MARPAEGLAGVCGAAMDPLEKGIGAGEAETLGRVKAGAAGGGAGAVKREGANAGLIAAGAGVGASAKAGRKVNGDGTDDGGGPLGEAGAGDGVTKGGAAPL